MMEQKHLNEAAWRIDDRMQSDYGVRLKRFDPTWMAILVPIIVDILQNCREDDPEKIRDAAVAARSWPWRWFPLGRRARRAVGNVIRSRLATEGEPGRKLSKAQKPLADSILAVGSDATIRDILNVQLETKHYHEANDAAP